MLLHDTDRIQRACLSIRLRTPHLLSRRIPDSDDSEMELYYGNLSIPRYLLHENFDLPFRSSHQELSMAKKMLVLVNLGTGNHYAVVRNYFVRPVPASTRLLESAIWNMLEAGYI